MDALERSLDVARTMLRGAAWAARVEHEKGLSPDRQRLAAENLVFWRERFASVWRQSCDRARAEGRPMAVRRTRA